MSKFYFLTLPMVLVAGAALAGPATEDGAKAMTTALQAYFGATDGVVSVVPSGDVYSVTLDASPFLAALPAADLKATVSPLTLSVTDQGNGLWGVKMDQALAMDISAPGSVEFHARIDKLTSEGTFDAALGAFAQNKGRMQGLNVDQTVTVPDQPAQHVSYQVPDADFSSTSVAGASGGIDSAASVKMPALAESFAVPLEPGAAPMDLSLTMKDYNFDYSAKGYRAGAVLDLLAYGVAHQADTKFEAAPLKALLTVALPVFDSVTGTGTTGKIEIASPVGTFSAEGSKVSVDLHGVISDGLLREAATLQGVTIPATLVPAWAAPLVPSDIGFDFSVSGYDAAAAAPLVIDMLDLIPNGTPAPGAEDKLLAALLPSGTVSLKLAPSSVGNANWTLDYEGAMQVGPQTEIPTGTAKLTLSGIDAIVATLNTAPDDIKGTVNPAMMFVRGLSKMVDGKLVWDIDASTPGSVLINGNDVMKAMQ